LSGKGSFTMAMDSAMIERLIREGIPQAKVEIEDLRGDGDHYAAYVESPAFEGKTRIQQHQMVFAALQGKLGDELHALSLTTAPAKPASSATP
jgi:stress-induced morphogen